MTREIDHAEQIAQVAANISGKAQLIYQRPNGEYVVCARGLESLLPDSIRAKMIYIKTIEPE